MSTTCGFRKQEDKAKSALQLCGVLPLLQMGVSVIGFLRACTNYKNTLSTPCGIFYGQKEIRNKFFKKNSIQHYENNCRAIRAFYNQSSTFGIKV